MHTSRAHQPCMDSVIFISSPMLVAFWCTPSISLDTGVGGGCCTDSSVLTGYAYPLWRNSNLCPRLCVCVYMIHARVCVPLCASRVQRRILDVILAAIRPQLSLLLLLPAVLGLQVLTMLEFVLCQCQDVNSVSHACAASTLSH